jgi:membrane-bound ClpP family serine protease
MPFPLRFALLALFIASPVVRADAIGLYVAVPVPLDDNGFTRIKNRIEAARNLGSARPEQVVLDFNPTDKDAAGASHGAAADLAEYISKLHDIGTIAFVHGKVTGHLVLPVLACKQIVMGKDSSLGEVVKADDPPLTDRQASAYPLILNAVRPQHAAIARKMYDKDVRLAKGQKGGGIWFIDLRDAKALEKDGVSVPDAKELGAAGGIGLFSQAQLREWNVVNGVAANRGELAEDFRILPGTLRDDPLAGRPPVAFRYTLKGAIDKGVAESVVRMARGVLERKGNILFLFLECGGGDLQAARELAENLQKLENPEGGGNGLMIVGFIPNDAPDTAAVIALGCSEIVMSRRTENKGADGEAAREAEFGNFEAALAKPGANAQLWAESLKPLVERQGYPAILIDGMLKKDVAIVRARSKVDRTKTRLMTQADLAAARNDWEQVDVVKPAGKLLKLGASEAQRLGIARSTTDTADPKELYSKYGVDPAKVQDATPAWLDMFANFIRDRMVTVLLVVIGFTGLILELKVPGATVPGIIAALCFILVFWAHTGFHGQVVVLAGLLFLLGLALILLEVFVFPGFGATGIVGVMLLLGSLTLVTVEELPKTGNQWIGFGKNASQYLFGLIAAVALSFTFTRYVRRIPVLNKMSLASPDEVAEAEAVPLPGAAQAARLLGAIGSATTPLRPAGTVAFGDEFVDVVTEGGFIPSGTRVQVVEVEGTRIVVKEV